MAMNPRKIGLSLILTLFCAHGFGQYDAADTLTSQIPEVTVTSWRQPNKDLLPAQVLSGSQLERLSAQSVADAIRYFSGVQIKDYGGIGGLKTVNIRSMGTNHVGVFYDGIELGNAQNGQIDLGRFSLDNLEAVSVYNGQRSSIFQSAKDFGSAGTVYLQSRTPEFEHGKDYNLRASFKTGSFGLANPSVVWEQKISQRLSASVSADYMYTNGRYKYQRTTDGGYDTTAVRENGDVSAARAEAGLYGSMANGEWRAKAYFYRSARGLPGAVVRNKLVNQDRQWDTNFFMQGSMTKRFSDFYSLKASCKYAYDYLHYLSDPSLDVSTMYVNNKFRQNEMYLSVSNLFTLDRHWSVSASTDYQLNTLDANLVNFVYPVRNTLLAAVATQADYGRVKAQASLLATFVSDEVRSNGTSAGDKIEFTPTVVVSYKPFAKVDFSLRGFYKNIFRMPTLNDLYYTFIGNTKLNPEYTDQYDIGFTYSARPKGTWLSVLELQVDGYYNKVKDKIVAMPTSNQYRWTMLNLGEVEIKGVDVSLQTVWELPCNITLDGRLSYTYQNAEDVTDPTESYYRDQIPYIPWHSGSLTLNAQWRNWELHYSFIYTGERYDASNNIPENYVPEWYTSDLALSFAFRAARARLRLTAEVNNIFNQQFEVVKCYPMPGTNYKLTIRLQI